MVYSVPKASGIKAAPQLIVLLDADARVMNVNGSAAGSLGASVSEHTSASLHEQLHPHCEGACRFAQLWEKAVRSLERRDSVEWEVDDQRLGRLMRLNLSIPPADPGVEVDRRSRRMLLSITDITIFRKEHRSLAQREQELSRILLEKGLDTLAQQVDQQHYQSLSRQVIKAQEEERKRIASDLHDGIAQTLGGTKYQIELAVENLRRKNPEIDLNVFDEVISKLKGAVEEVRRISTNLAPSMLEDFGLCVAVEWLCKECQELSDGIEVRATNCIDECKLPDLMNIAIYRVVQEALSNAARHSGASQILVSLSSGPNGVEMSVVDNGDGFSAAQLNGGLAIQCGNGLRNMRERVAATGGFFSIETAEGEGTTLFASWDQAAIESLADEPVLDGVNRNG